MHRSDDLANPRCAPLNVESRVNALAVSPTGLHVCVALMDRLLLVGVNYDGGVPKLYIRSILDIVHGYRCIVLIFTAPRLADVFPSPY